MNSNPALFLRKTLPLLLLAAAPAVHAIPLSDRPLFLTGDTPPMVMLNLSKDHQLSYKAYNDFTDLDGDGTPDITYKHSFSYYGYFDPFKCYTYNTTNQRFAPASITTDKYCNASGTSGQWSGNFLNWISMTRMDIVRKILYGGMRSTDTSALTVLERAYLPTDAHSYAKYYNGTDIARLTPFTTAVNTPQTSTSTSTVDFTAGTKTVVTALSFEVGDQIRLQDASNSSRWMVGGVSAKAGTTMTLVVESSGLSPTATGNASNWVVTNLNSAGITFCNTTIGRGDATVANRVSHTNTNPPLIRVAQGNFTLWGANEKQQCLWSEERNNLQSGFAGGFRSNGNRALLSGINASAENPMREVHGLGTGVARGAYVARVEVCSALLIGTETCKRYPAGNYKPSGLLQEYGDDGQILFGMMTGSFERNVSGGVLRQPVGDFGAGVNHRSTDPVRDGTFKTSAGRPTNGIIRNLDALRIYGYSYQNDNSYGTTDGCTYQRTGIRITGALNNDADPTVNQGSCSSWGNPMAEIYLESLRYLAHTATGPGPTGPTAAFTYTDAGSRDAALGLTIATWSPPLNDQNYCTPLSVLNFNASVSSYDADQVESPPNSSLTAAQLTDAVGGFENINGNSWFVGSAGASGDNLCSAKTLSSFGEALGLCPEAPTLEGSYLIAGLAHYARTNRIKPLPGGVNGNDFPNALKVETYGVALATNVPRIEVNAGGRRVTILPAYRLDRSSTGVGPFGGGTLVDFKIVEQTATYGRFYVNWEDSAFGGDYDQDMWGTIEYRVVGDTIRVTTNAVSASTANGQGFGYVISGTDADGPHFHSGIYNFDYTDARNVTVIREDTGVVANNATTGFINASGGCRNCTVDNPPTSVVYNITGNSAGSLKDPLWYAAKYGGFRDTNGNNRPDLQSEWDSSGDGNPDNFVFANDPLRLVEGLARAFEQIGRRRSSAAAIASNSTQLNTETAIYQARFDSARWSGSLRALRLQAGGIVGTQLWDAAQQIPAADARNILTHDGSTGRNFTWDTLSDAQRTQLNVGPGNVVDTLGSQRVSFLRGSRSQERANGGNFRDRDQVLGDIINSDPFFVRQQYFGYERLPGTEGSTYNAFVTANANRTPMIYVGANDGMLHAFNATTGAEVFAYVPRSVYGKLWELTDPDYNDRHLYFADGSPYVGEAYIGGAWGSYLVSGLGAGGRSVFAIDVTSPTAVTASSVRWEYTEADLCYTFSQPQIARLPNGSWAAIFGNGYPKTTGSYQCTTSGAYLYVVDLATGSLISKIGVDAGNVAYDGANNGLSTPALVDTNGDRVIDTVYAGDLFGNLWKFDLSQSNPSGWSVANRDGPRGRPLFSARNANDQRQPITAPVEVGRHPSGGFMVYFGTGRYVAEGDPSDLTVQSFYGIWDRPGTGTSNEITYTATTRTSVLQQQTLLSETTVSGRDVRTVSANAVNWATQRGWYLDLIQPTTPPTQQGERVVDAPLLRFGRVIFNTLIPSTSTCSFGGTSWLLELSALTGQRLNETVLDVNGDGVFNADDYAGGIPVSGMRSSVGITSTPTVITAGSREFKLQSGSDTSGTNEGVQVTTERGGDRPPRGSWRQLIAR